MRGTPLQTHHEARDTANTKETTNIVDPLQDVCCGVFSSKARWIVVAEDAEEKANEVPDTNEDTVVTPVAGLSNELGVED